MIQNRVILHPEKHQYFDTNGNEYLSVSSLLNQYAEKFDAKKMAKLSAGKGKYAGLSADEVEILWKQTGKDSSEHGTRIHNALELYSKKYEILSSDSDLEPLVKSITSDYKEYYIQHDECALYYPFESPVGKYWGIAGTADKILEVSVRSNYFDVDDFKTNNRKGIEYHSKYNKYMLSPVSHLQDCNFVRYALQIGFYGLMMEGLTGKKFRSGSIRTIPPENFLSHKKIPVPYLKTDCLNIIQDFQNKSITLTDTEIISSEESPIFE